MTSHARNLSKLLEITILKDMGLFVLLLSLYAHEVKQVHQVTVLSVNFDLFRMGADYRTLT